MTRKKAVYFAHLKAAAVTTKMQIAEALDPHPKDPREFLQSSRFCKFQTPEAMPISYFNSPPDLHLHVCAFSPLRLK